MIYRIKYQLASGEVKFLDTIYRDKDIAINRVNDLSSYITDKVAIRLDVIEYKESNTGTYVFSQIYTLYWDKELNDWNFWDE